MPGRGSPSSCGPLSPRSSPNSLSPRSPISPREQLRTIKTLESLSLDDATTPMNSCMPSVLYHSPNSPSGFSYKDGKCHENPMSRMKSRHFQETAFRELSQNEMVHTLSPNSVLPLVPISKTRHSYDSNKGNNKIRLKATEREITTREIQEPITADQPLPMSNPRGHLPKPQHDPQKTDSHELHYHEDGITKGAAIESFPLGFCEEKGLCNDRTTATFSINVPQQHDGKALTEPPTPAQGKKTVPSTTLSKEQAEENVGSPTTTDECTEQQTPIPGPGAEALDNDNGCPVHLKSEENAAWLYARSLRMDNETRDRAPRYHAKKDAQQASLKIISRGS
ncbi:uncharacterized protein LOC116602967 [Nematostella vectensis]|uniref:uncharacterized protein LOC116602967 n=1 Tax=Nematostella vectensis TaxID=45351 RepID=UPI00138FDB5A|nr:uncharacterized protein LOC116602967 [Nematostella vectensis]